MVETVEQFRALFPEITDEQVTERADAAKAADEALRAEKVAEADRKIQSLRDQLIAAEQERAALDAQG